MKNLKDEDVLRVMREEWYKKVNALSEAVDLMLSTKVDGEEKQVVSKGLSIRHKKDKKIFTVGEVGPTHVRLVSPDGQELDPISAEKLEDEYELA
jgi:hypothetical protein